MEADVVRWLQCLRHTVAEESDGWNFFGAHHDSVLDSAIDTLFDFGPIGSVSDLTVDDTLFDFDSTTSVSDFEYYSMDQPYGRVFFTVDGGGISQQNSAVIAWKNDLFYCALDRSSSEDEQVLTTPSLIINKQLFIHNIFIL